MLVPPNGHTILYDSPAPRLEAISNQVRPSACMVDQSSSAGAFFVVGFFAAATGVVPRQAMRTAVEKAVPPGTQELNLRAFDAGWAAFEEDYSGQRGASVGAADRGS